jgi:guanylate kinase
LSGSLIVVSAPSGAGKSSLVKALIASMENVQVAVSHTTRVPRPGEVNGEHYHFVDPDRFRQMVAEDAFLEHAQVFDNYYGTARQSLQAPLRAGCDLILEIDWQGARQVAELFPDAISLFIAPPGLEALRDRLVARGQDARAEMSHANEFDYLLINDVFDEALAQMRCLVSAVRLRRELQIRRHPQLFDGLLGET